MYTIDCVDPNCDKCKQASTGPSSEEGNQCKNPETLGQSSEKGNQCKIPETLEQSIEEECRLKFMNTFEEIVGNELLLASKSRGDILLNCKKLKDELHEKVDTLINLLRKRELDLCLEIELMGYNQLKKLDSDTTELCAEKIIKKSDKNKKVPPPRTLVLYSDFEFLKTSLGYFGEVGYKHDLGIKKEWINVPIRVIDAPSSGCSFDEDSKTKATAKDDESYFQYEGKPYGLQDSSKVNCEKGRSIKVEIEPRQQDEYSRRRQEPREPDVFIRKLEAINRKMRELDVVSGAVKRSPVHQQHPPITVEVIDGTSTDSPFNFKNECRKDSFKEESDNRIKHLEKIQADLKLSLNCMREHENRRNTSKKIGAIKTCIMDKKSGADDTVLMNPRRDNGLAIKTRQLYNEFVAYNSMMGLRTPASFETSVLEKYDGKLKSLKKISKLPVADVKKDKNASESSESTSEDVESDSSSLEIKCELPVADLKKDIEASESSESTSEDVENDSSLEIKCELPVADLKKDIEASESTSEDVENDSSLDEGDIEIISKKEAESIPMECVIPVPSQNKRRFKLSGGKSLKVTILQGKKKVPRSPGSSEKSKSSGIGQSESQASSLSNPASSGSDSEQKKKPSFKKQPAMKSSSKCHSGSKDEDKDLTAALRSSFTKYLQKNANSEWLVTEMSKPMVTCWKSKVVSMPAQELDQWLPKGYNQKVASDKAKPAHK